MVIKVVSLLLSISLALGLKVESEGFENVVATVRATGDYFDHLSENGASSDSSGLEKLVTAMRSFGELFSMDAAEEARSMREAQENEQTLTMEQEGYNRLTVAVKLTRDYLSNLPQDTKSSFFAKMIADLFLQHQSELVSAMHSFQEMPNQLHDMSVQCMRASLPKAANVTSGHSEERNLRQKIGVMSQSKAFRSLAILVMSLAPGGHSALGDPTADDFAEHMTQHMITSITDSKTRLQDIVKKGGSIAPSLNEAMNQLGLQVMQPIVAQLQATMADIVLNSLDSMERLVRNCDSFRSSMKAAFSQLPAEAAKDMASRATF